VVYKRKRARERERERNRSECVVLAQRVAATSRAWRVLVNLQSNRQGVRRVQVKPHQAGSRVTQCGSMCVRAETGSAHVSVCIATTVTGKRKRARLQRNQARSGEAQRKRVQECTTSGVA